MDDQIRISPQVAAEDNNEQSQILIVDDDQLNIEAMKHLLQQFNLSASYARGGHDAFRLV